MRVFLSYAAKDRNLAEAVSLALRAQGHTLFFDRTDLPPGEEYDVRIRRGIEKSQLFVFLLSPDAVDAGSYTLTELGIAQRVWRHPAGKVLPVVIRPVPLDQIPPYLKSVTLLEPEGNLPATVADAVHRIALARQRKFFKTVMTGLAMVTIFCIGGYVYWVRPSREITGMDGASAVVIPAGNFTMGDDEHSPLREIYLAAFYIDKYEITVSRYAKFLKTTGGVKPPDRWQEASLESAGELPVVGVDWHDADAYCRWAGKRLPTEAEWEKAARGTDGRSYPWGNDAPTSMRANFGRSAENPYNGGLAPAGGRPDGGSPFGVEDAAGNVAEWVADWFAESFSRGDVRNPKGPASGTAKVIRGGGWNDPPDRLKASRRMHASPTNRTDDVGFRCARDLHD
jgi:formylglycine-generating enzyme required for sulfatase activity